MTAPIPAGSRTAANMAKPAQGATGPQQQADARGGAQPPPQGRPTGPGAGTGR